MKLSSRTTYIIWSLTSTNNASSFHYTYRTRPFSFKSLNAYRVVIELQSSRERYRAGTQGLWSGCAYPEEGKYKTTTTEGFGSGGRNTLRKFLDNVNTYLDLVIHIVYINTQTYITTVERSETFKATIPITTRENDDICEALDIALQHYNDARYEIM